MPASPPPLRLLLAGATGVVGRAVLDLALVDARVAHVTALARRPLARAPHARLTTVLADFGQLAQDAPCWQVDAVICTLGTTRRAAGSDAAFAAVDRDLVHTVARLARAGGATRFALNSSLGADARSRNFYLRTKGEAEQLVGSLGYPGLTIVRPALIDAARAERRPGEHAGLVLAHVLRPLIPARYRPVTPAAIARALLDGALATTPGHTVVESEQLA